MWDAGSSPTSTVARPTWPRSATLAATSSRTLAASALPSIMVAAIGLSVRENAAVLPRKNDPASIASRRETLGLNGDADLTAYLKAAETVTGLAVIPVSVAQLHVSRGGYEPDENGAVGEAGPNEERGGVRLGATAG